MGTPSTFADDKELCGVVMHWRKGRSIQRDPNRGCGTVLASWSSAGPRARSCTRAGAIPAQRQTGQRMYQKQVWGEGLGAICGQKVQYDLAVCAHSTESQPCPRLHQKTCGQQVKGDDSHPLCRFPKTFTWSSASRSGAE